MRLTPITDDSGQLEAQAFAKRGRCLEKYIMAFNNCRDNFSLQWTSTKSAKLTRFSAIRVPTGTLSCGTRDANRILDLVFAVADLSD